MASEYYQKHTVPSQFPLILRNFTREVLRLQPKNIVEFSAKYFRSLVDKKTFEWDESKSRGPLPCDYPRVNVNKNLKVLPTTEQPQPYVSKKSPHGVSGGKTAKPVEEKAKIVKEETKSNADKHVVQHDKPGSKEKTLSGEGHRNKEATETHTGHESHKQETRKHEEHKDEAHKHEGHKEETHKHEEHKQETHKHEEHKEETHKNEEHKPEVHKEETHKHVEHKQEEHKEETHKHVEHKPEEHKEETHKNVEHKHEEHKEETHKHEEHKQETHEHVEHKQETHKHEEHKHEEHKHEEHKHEEHKHEEHKHEEHKHEEHKHEEHKHEEHKHEEHKHEEHKHEEHKHEEHKSESHTEDVTRHPAPKHTHKSSVGDSSARDALNISGNISLPSNPEEAAEAYVDNLIERSENTLVNT